MGNTEVCDGHGVDELQDARQGMITAMPKRVDFAKAQRHVLLGVMVVYLFFYTGRQNLGFAVKGMQGELGYSSTDIAWLNAAMLVGYGVGQALNGNLSDIIGARWMVGVGATLSLALNWGFSFASSAGLAIGLWFGNGLVQSAASPALRRLIVNWFPPEERGRALGWHLLSAGFSSSLTYALCIWTLTELDWRWLFRLPVLTIVIGTSAFLLLVKNRPGDAGLDPLPVEESELAAPSGHETSWERYRQVLRSGSFLLCCVSIGFESLVRYGLLSWVPVHFLKTSNLWVTLGLPVGMALGAFSAGRITDRFFPGRRAWVASALMAMAAIPTFLLSLMPTDSPLAFGLLLVAGFLVYAPQPSYWALGPALVGRERAGTATGLMDASAYAFAALGQVAIGQTIDLTGSTFPVFVLLAGACLAGALVILPVKR
jgi:OPA family glycerol-3-phosphate transporter-like MFS transporter